MLTLTWIKCDNGANWCPLTSVNLSNVKVGGVYLIWHEGAPGHYVRVGQGNIADRLNHHRNDKKILAYAESGTLRVTWAAVPAAQQNGVEHYLADKCQPLIGDAFPEDEPIAVNLPK